MPHASPRRGPRTAVLCALGVACLVGGRVASGQEPAPPPRLLQISAEPPPAPLETPALEPGDRPLPIDLPTALRLANVQAVDVVAAAERLNAAFAVLDQAKVSWLPTITLGGDYNRHDGKIQNADGSVIDVSRNGWMYGAGTGIGSSAVLSLDDAIFGPLVARQTVRARQADLQAARNDTLVAVTDAYFNVQQARGQLAGAVDARRRAEELVRRTEELKAVSGLAPGLEVTRAAPNWPAADRRNSRPASNGWLPAPTSCASCASTPPPASSRRSRRTCASTWSRRKNAWTT